MTFELIFLDEETEEVKFVVTDVVTVRWITPSEIGLTVLDGRLARCRFKPGERLVIERRHDNPRIGENSREKHSI